MEDQELPLWFPVEDGPDDPSMQNLWVLGLITFLCVLALVLSVTGPVLP